MLSGVILGPLWSNFGNLWAPKSNFFVIVWGFFFRSKNHEFWNRLRIEKYPERSQKDLPDSTISKDLSSILRTIKASGQEAECRRLEESKHWGRRLNAEG